MVFLLAYFVVVVVVFLFFGFSFFSLLVWGLS